MSVNITINHAVKKFGENTIIPDLSLDIKDKEFFTLLGPSGCGKTTLLRMIAGFNTIEGGSFFFDEKCINEMEVSRRNIGMVFQKPNPFPMSIFENVVYPLRIDGERRKPVPDVDRGDDKGAITCAQAIDVRHAFVAGRNHDRDAVPEDVVD